ncbi:MAG: caspase family protein [Planctomycetes bacterium]|nr:caspase family protein [Planctomycetota bacterium]
MRRIILICLSGTLLFNSQVSCSVPSSNEGNKEDSKTDLSKKAEKNEVIDNTVQEDEKYSLSITPFINQFFTNLGFDKARMRQEAIASAKTIEKDAEQLGVGISEGAYRLLLRQSFVGNDFPIYAIAISPDNRFMVSSEVCHEHDKCAHKQHTVKLLDLKTFYELKSFAFNNSIWAVTFSPDSKYFAVADGCLRWPCPHKGHPIWIIDAVTYKDITSLSGHESDVYALAFSSDGRYLASGGRDKTVRVWDTSSWKQYKNHTLHTDSVFTVSFASVDGNYVLSGSADKTVKLWRLSDNQLVNSFVGHTEMVNRLAVSPNGEIFVSGGVDKIAMAWSLSTFDLLYALSGHTGDIRSIAFSPDGKVIATGAADKSLKLWNASTGYEISSINSQHNGYVNALAFTPDGQMLISGSGDKYLRVWDLGRYKNVPSIAGKHKVQKIPWGYLGINLQMLGSDELQEYGLVNGLKILVLQKDAPAEKAGLKVGDIILTANNKVFDSAYDAIIEIRSKGAGGKAHFEVLSDGKKKSVEVTLGSNPSWHIEEASQIEESNGSFFAAAVSPDHKLLATTSKNGTIRLWDIASKKKVGVLEEVLDPIISLGFHPEYPFLLFGETASGDEIATLVTEKDSVDFSFGKPVRPPYPLARAQMLTSDTISAGEQVKFNLVVDNTKGKGDLYQVIALTECDTEPLFDKKVILIGYVQAKQEMTKSVTFDTDFKSQNKQATVKFRFSELNDNYPEGITAVVNIKSQPRPDFAVTVQVFDGQSGRGTGNADGILQSRESPEIQIAVRNTGFSRAVNSVVEISNLPSREEGVQIFGDLKKKLGDVDSSGVNTHIFELLIKPIYKKQSVSFRVRIREDSFGIEKTEEVTLAIGKATDRKPISVNRLLKATEDKVPLYSGAGRDTDVLGYLPLDTQIIAKAWLGEFYQVELDKGAIAWIETSKLNEISKEDISKNKSVEPLKVLIESDNQPIVAVLSPEAGYITDEKRIKIKGFAKDDRGVKRLEVSINGKMVVSKSVEGRKYDFSEDVELEDGSNRIEVAVEDTKSNRDRMQIEVSYLGRYPILKNFYKNIWAVIIGIDNYKDASVPGLKYAVKDAKGIESLLRSNVVSGRIIGLYNEEATRENIMKILQGELSELKNDDAVFVYFACHGKTFQSERGTLGDLIPYDGSFNEKERYKNISMQIFKDDVAKSINAKHMFVVVDACYGGVLTRGVGIKKEEIGEFRKNEYLDQVKNKEAKIVMTAGSDQEEVLDKGLGDHSVFTGRLIESIQESKFFVSAKELYGQVRWKVEEDASRRSHKQTPQFGYWWGDGDFIFIKK